MERKIERERNRRREFVNRSIDAVNARVSDELCLSTCTQLRVAVKEARKGKVVASLRG